jgi:DNA-binding transcriptional LysR family regulator
MTELGRLADINPALLHCFLLLAESRSFTVAAARLGIRQSTVSQQLKRLEATLGHRLFARDTHSVKLTAEGDALLGMAREIVEANARLVRFFSGQAGRQRLRLGISEDFAMSGLSDVLIRFGRDHPDVDIELTVGLSGFLYQLYDSGELDVIFVKRKPGDRRGEIAWRERLAWIGRLGLELARDRPVPLVAYNPPSITRTLAIGVLDTSDRAWRLACSSGSLNGLRAALMASLGVAAHSRLLLPPGLAILSTADLPPLPEVEFVAIGPGGPSTLANTFVHTLISSREALQRVAR